MTSQRQFEEEASAVWGRAAVQHNEKACVCVCGGGCGGVGSNYLIKLPKSKEDLKSKIGTKKVE